MGENQQIIDCFESSKIHFDHATQKLNLSAEMQSYLLHPSREVTVRFPVLMDDRSIRIFEGYRVQHNNARGPNKGGLRFHPDVTLADVRGLAAWMTWKCALLDLPFGGGKGAVVCNPHEMSSAELELVTRKYIQSIRDTIGPNTDIPAPDVNTNEDFMAWILDEYSRLKGYTTAVVTGKPIELGGTPGRKEATGRGVFYTIREYLKDHEIDIKNTTAVIQGFGNVGYHLALFLSRAGCRVIGISDSRFGVVNESGLDIEMLYQHKKETGSVSGFTKAKTIPTEIILTLDCDFLIPAALQNAIHGKNYREIKAKVIFEAANGATCPLIEEKLMNQGVEIYPDILVNGGGVTVSYFEWVQNLQQVSWSEETVNRKLEHTILSAYRKIKEHTRNNSTSLRTAAYIIAIDKVAQATKKRGIY